MSNTSARLGLPYLMPAQAQKHVTHNEALQRLDALAQLVVEGIDATTPPASPVDGAVYALGMSPVGDWTGHAGQLAYWTGAGWLFLAPQEGWRTWDKGTGVSRAFQGSDWVASDVGLENLPGVGIGTTSNSVNKLSVAADATLLTHDGAGHQLKLNKAAAADTASLLYQSAFDGRAEMGLTGDNDFHIKVSPDGSTWTEALVLDVATGLASGAAVQTDAQDTTAGRLARAEFVYGPGSVLGSVSMVAGAPAGAVIERDSNANGHYVRFADGTQICWHDIVIPSVTSADGALFTTSTNQNWTYPAGFVAMPRVWGAGRNGGATTGVAVRTTPGAASVGWRPWSTVSGAGAYGNMLMAIGRWV